MTSKQKLILWVLVLGNVLILCIVAPVIILMLNSNADNSAQLPTSDSSAFLAAVESPTPTQLSAPTVRPTLTPQPTKTPAPTYTRVIQAVALPTNAQGNQTGALTTKSKNTPIPPEAGWRAYSIAAEGYIIDLPSTWMSVKMDTAMGQNMLKQRQQTNPVIAPSQNGQSAQNLAYQFHFYGFDSVKNSTASINIIYQILPAAQTLNAYTNSILQDMNGSPNLSKPIGNRLVTLPSVDAARLSYIFTLNPSSNNVQVHSTVQYLIVRGTAAYIITFSTNQAQAKQYEALFDKIATTFQWMY